MAEAARAEQQQEDVVIEALGPLESRRIPEPDRRVGRRDPLEGTAELRAPDGCRVAAAMVDLGQGGCCVLSPVRFEVGACLRLEIAGLMTDVRVCHVADGARYRIGLRVE